MEGKESKTMINVEEEMRRSYLDYAMSVIVGRALPDVRDGLKPVHRRVLFAMHDTGNTAEKTYRKSARAVGAVIGRFHPHGDSAVYDTIVRLAQEFSMRYPLVDGQGNFGSVDGDRPAAMRYTEIRLQKLAGHLLNDIDKDTVDFAPNYDGTEQEPTILPAAYPNLLVNGSSGIAVGMATNIPPHNLREIAEGIKLVVRNPDCDLAELMELIPGPDFPTAGYIYGAAGIQSAYQTGRGRIQMRGRAEIEEDRRRKNCEMIVVNELPYQVNKAQLIEEIAGLVRDKKIEGIHDIRDESDRDGIRMVIELKRGENANVILNKLYKFTKLQTTFGMISLALVNGRPQVLPLKEILQQFVAFRREVIVRRTNFELRKAEERAHILEGLKIAIDNLDEVIAIIRKAKNPPEAKESLRLRFHFTDRQAQAILDMRLQRLTGLERQKIVDEYDAVLKLIERLKLILSSQGMQLDLVLQELEAVVEKHADPRRTEILHVEGEISIEDLIKDEEMVITVSHTGYIKRTPLAMYQQQQRGGKGRKGMTTRDEDAVRQLFVASTHDYILAFTSRGRMHWLKVHELPHVATAGKGRPVVNLIPIEGDERVETMLSVREFTEGRFVMLATRRGIIKKTPLSAFSRPRAGGIIAVSIDENDRLLSAGLSGGEDEIFMATAKGKSIRFNENDVRPMGRNARGVIGIRLIGDDDELVEAEVLSGEPDILVVTENGYGKRTSIDEYRLQGRGGSGIINIRTNQRNGLVVACMAVADEDEVLMITSHGKIIRIAVSGVSRIGRSTQGVRMIYTDEHDVVASAIRSETTVETLGIENAPEQATDDSSGETSGDSNREDTGDSEGTAENGEEA